MSKQLFLAQDFATNILCANVNKMYEYDKNQMPYCNFLIQKVNSKNFGPLIEHGPHWINFTILTFIVKTIDTLETYVKFRTKLLRLK
jgi:hypothetical protein